MSAAVKGEWKSSLKTKLTVLVVCLMALTFLVGGSYSYYGQYKEALANARDKAAVSAHLLSGIASNTMLTMDYTLLDESIEKAMENEDVLFVRVVTQKGDTLRDMKKDRPDRRLEVKKDIAVAESHAGDVILGFSTEKVFATLSANVKIAVLQGLIGLTFSSALLIFFLNRFVVEPVGSLKGVMDSVAGGNLGRSAEVKTNDELGVLARSANKMIGYLKGMIGSVRETAGSVGRAAHDMQEVSARLAAGSREQLAAVEEASSSVTEMHSSLKEIGGNVEDLNGTAEQTSSAVIETSASIEEVARTMGDLSTAVEETSTAITQMSAAIRHIAENVESLSSSAEATAASAGEVSASVKEVEASAKHSAMLAEAVSGDAQELGMRSIEKTIDGMRRIEEESRSTAEVINRLGGRAESIGVILTVIEDITDQTSLLALNAAILAAQAGEHGKGFAVVAGEIRELANRTASSTKEIGTLIVSVQEESREAVEAMRRGVALTEEGTRLARDAGAALSKILEGAGRARDMSRSISKAAMEQAAGMKQASEEADRISEMSRQIAKATADQRAGSEQIMRAADRMREIARFVKNATAEQVKASKDITAAMEAMNGKVGRVHHAAAEVRSGSDLIVQAMERIKTIAKENAAESSKLGGAVEVMTDQARTLTKEIEKFHA